MPKRKKERYIDRWRKQHKEVRLYLKEEYEALEKLASERNMTVKDFILKFINDVNAIAAREYDKGYDEGYQDALRDFVNDPDSFHGAVRELLEYKGDVALFEAPCSICGKPMVFTHKDENWESKVKPKLLEAFKWWYHVRCKEQLL